MAVAVVVLGLVAGQAVAFAIVAAAGGKGASDEATAAGLVLDPKKRVLEVHAVNPRTR